MSREVAENFKEALWKVEEDRDVEPMISVLAEDCEVGNVAVPETFHGHDEAREFWTEYRKTFDEMKSTFRNVFADDGRGPRWSGPPRALRTETRSPMRA